MRSRRSSRVEVPRSARTAARIGSVSSSASALATMPSVVSIPPNRSTTALATSSSGVSAGAPGSRAAATAPAAAPSSDSSPACSIASVRRRASAACAAARPRAAAPGGQRVDRRHDRLVGAADLPGLRAVESERASEHARGQRPGKLRPQVACPVRPKVAQQLVALGLRGGGEVFAHDPGRNGAANGARWRSCSAPSRLSMLAPTRRAVEKRSSCTVNVAGSRITATARS